MGELAALLAALTWAVTSIALTSLSARTAPAVLSGLRLGFGALAMPIVVIAADQVDALSSASASTIAQVVASGALGYGLGDTLYILALNRLGMHRTFPVSMALYIGLTVLGGVLLLGEPFSWGLPAGAALIVLGVTLVAVPAAGSAGPAPATAPLAGAALLLGVGVTWAAATLWLAHAGEGLEAIAVGAVRTPAGAVALLLFAAAFQRPALLEPLRSPGRLAAIALAGLAGTTLGSLLYVYAVLTAGAGRTAILTATSPLLALPLAVFVLREPLTRRIAAGTLACVLGIVLVVS
ncbi:DMT family transporter [Tepidiforma sp.]|uniref:DMT family transporter n=1 Tax=Tepidiforma sp. TaxID=2682230 RepID=UPI002ADDAC0B|nr:DMT family transporter [Tepidiforma sp.]